MASFERHITCAFLYAITRYGYPPAAGDSARYVREMAALGFRSVELEGIGAEHLAGVESRREEVRAALAECGVELPVFCVVLPGLGSSERASREQSLAAFERGCALARYLGAGGVLDNGPLAPYAFPAGMAIERHYSPQVLRSVGLPAGLDWEPYYHALAQTVRRACDIAADQGLDYYLHPCAGSLTETTDSFLLLARHVDRKNLKFNFDTANQFFVRENLALGLRKLAGHVDYIHLSDNGGLRTEHLPAGEGAIDWDQFFTALREIRFAGRLAIDVGGAESGVDDLNEAYLRTARWIEEKIKEYELFA